RTSVKSPLEKVYITNEDGSMEFQFDGQTSTEEGIVDLTETMLVAQSRKTTFKLLHEMDKAFLFDTLQINSQFLFPAKTVTQEESIAIYNKAIDEFGSLSS